MRHFLHLVIETAQLYRKDLNPARNNLKESFENEDDVG